MQSLFYLLGFNREEICEPHTNALDFKKVRELINETLLYKMGTFKPTGQKTGEFKEYKKIRFLKTNLESCGDEEKVEAFSLVLLKIL